MAGEIVLTVVGERSLTAHRGWIRARAILRRLGHTPRITQPTKDAIRDLEILSDYVLRGKTLGPNPALDDPTFDLQLAAPNYVIRKALEYVLEQMESSAFEIDPLDLGEMTDEAKRRTVKMAIAAVAA